jgi:hypothetical protein
MDVECVSGSNVLRQHDGFDLQACGYIPDLCYTALTAVPYLRQAHGCHAVPCCAAVALELGNCRNVDSQASCNQIRDLRTDFGAAQTARCTSRGLRAVEPWNVLLQPH